jgi:hypothetical protein
MASNARASTRESEELHGELRFQVKCLSEPLTLRHDNPKQMQLRSD